MNFATGARRANESRVLQVEFLVCPPSRFGSIGRFTTTEGVFLLFAYQIAVIDMSRSLMFGVDGSLWLAEYRGIPLLGRTGYLTEIMEKELKPWKSKLDKKITDRYVQMFELLAENEMPIMEDFDIEGYSKGFLSVNA